MELRQSKEWSIDTELLAQLIEEVSILAAEQRRRKPREVRRPDFLRRNSAGKRGMAHAVNVLTSNARRIHSR